MLSYVAIWTLYLYIYMIGSTLISHDGLTVQSQQKNICSTKVLYLHWGFCTNQSPFWVVCDISWISSQPTGCRAPPKYLGCHRWFRGSRKATGTGIAYSRCLLHLGEVDSLGLKVKKRLTNQPGDVLGWVFSAQTCDVILLRLEDWRHRIAIFLL